MSYNDRDFRLRITWRGKLILQKKCPREAFGQIYAKTYWRDAKIEDFDLLEQYSFIHPGDLK